MKTYKVIIAILIILTGCSKSAYQTSYTGEDKFIEVYITSSPIQLKTYYLCNIKPLNVYDNTENKRTALNTINSIRKSKGQEVLDSMTYCSEISKGIMKKGTMLITQKNFHKVLKAYKNGYTLLIKSDYPYPNKDNDSLYSKAIIYNTLRAKKILARTYSICR